MPKGLAGSIATEVAKVKASEPLIIVEVQWGGLTKFYAEQAYGLAEPRLLEISNLTTIIKVGSSG